MKRVNRHKYWWKGHRGEWYVVAQAILLLLVAFGPVTWLDLPAWPAPYNEAGHWLGILLMIAGIGLTLVATLHLGDSLTPLPYPKTEGKLAVHGAYRLVRHPIYSGLIMASSGWALWLNSWITLCYALLLLIFFDIKSRREERWLAEKYPDYRDYQLRVRKLIPFLY